MKSVKFAVGAVQTKRNPPQKWGGKISVDAFMDSKKKIHLHRTTHN